jgi:hypothetical protein
VKGARIFKKILMRNSRAPNDLVVKRVSNAESKMQKATHEESAPTLPEFLRSSLDALLRILKSGPMKVIILLFLPVFGASLLTSCESDIASGTEVPEKFERGIRGQGKLYEPDHSPNPGSPNYDPSVREEARSGY